MFAIAVAFLCSSPVAEQPSVIFPLTLRVPGLSREKSLGDEGGLSPLPRSRAWDAATLAGENVGSDLSEASRTCA